MLFKPTDYENNGITKEDLEKLIEYGVEESIHLEYKKQLNNNDKIAKVLSSFANSDGGNVIYGIIEEEHKPIEINPLEPKDIREKIDQIAHNNIDPPLNVKIWPVDIKTQGQVYVVYIPKKYTYLQFAKSLHKFYKRTNFTSTPMERFEIEQAFNLVSEKKKSINLRIEKDEKEFVDLIGDHNLEIRLIVSPVQFGEKLFQITSDMNDFILNNIPKTPNFHNNVINKANLNWEECFRVNDFYFPYYSGHPASCIIKDDGIIIYNLSYVVYEEFELEEYYKENEIYKDDDEEDEELTSLIEEGIFYEQKKFHREINADYLMGFLDYISKLYNNANYTGDIMVKFKAIGIENCVDYHINSKFRQNRLEPIEKIYSQEIIQKAPIKVVKDFFNPILAGFGYLPINLQEFYYNVEHNKLLRQ